MPIGDGFLAIWSDVTQAHETDYLHWLTREHTAERLSVPGFRGVRVHRAARGDMRRYLIRYDLDDAGVMASAGYLARLNAPSAWSQRTMPQLMNFARGGGRVAARAGFGAGGAAAVVRFEHALPRDLAAAVPSAMAADRVALAELLEVDAGGTTLQTNEKSLRSADALFAGLLVIEGTDSAAVAQAAAKLAPDATVEPYSLVFFA